MIKALKEQGPHGCPLLMLGLDHENLARLKDGKPIFLDIDQCAMLGLGQREILIFSGQDSKAMMRELEEHGQVPEGATERLQEEFQKRGFASESG